MLWEKIKTLGNVLWVVESPHPKLVFGRVRGNKNKKQNKNRKKKKKITRLEGMKEKKKIQVI